MKILILDDDRVKITVAQATARIVFPASDIQLMFLSAEDARGEEELVADILLANPDIVVLDITLDTQAFPSGRLIAIGLVELSGGCEHPCIVMHSPGWEGSALERHFKRNGVVNYGASPEMLRSELERLRAEKFSDL